MLGPWQRERPDATGATQADRLVEDLRLYVLSCPPGMPVDHACVCWLVKRLRSASPTSVMRYWAWVTPHLQDAVGVPMSGLPMVRLALRRLAKIHGRGRAKDGGVIGPEEFARYVSDPSLPSDVRAASVIAWRRAARVADVAEVREGGLASTGLPVLKGSRMMVEVFVEVVFDKSHPTGTLEKLAFWVTEPEFAHVRPFVTEHLARSHPSTRRLMFPGLTAAGVGAHLSRIVGRPLGGHVFRRSAIQLAIAAGVPSWAIVAVTLHGSREGFLAYARTPLPEVVEAASLVSTALL